MKRIFVSAILVWFSAAPCAAAGSPAAETEDPLIVVEEDSAESAADQVPPAEEQVPSTAPVVPPADEAAIFRKEFRRGDPLLPKPSDKPSVNISEEFGVAEGVGSRKNIDGYLGEFENPYAPLDATYKGSRSEMRDEINERKGR